MRLARFTTLALIALAALPALAAEAEPGEMSVAYLQGEATATRGDLGTFPLAARTRLEAGDIIQTGKASNAEISLPTGSVLRLGSNARLELQNEPQGSFRAKLSLGNLWAKVVKLVGGSRFEIETQNGVAGVRGTEFRVAAQASGQAMVRVYEGRVQVKGASFDHLVEPGRELRFGAKAQLGPRPFDSKSERGFMRWVRRRDEQREGKNLKAPKTGVDNNKDGKVRERLRPLRRQ